jgi:hypothetical protein
MQRIGDTHYTKAIREWNTKFHVVPEMTPLRAKLIQEEVDELYEAIGLSDRQGIVDGLCDVVYVAAGTQVARGIVLVTDAIDFTPDYSSADDLSLLYAIDAEASLTSPTADMFLASLICHCELMAKARNIDLRKNFDIVHANNMAKTWTMDQLGMTDVSSTEVTIRGLNEYIVKNLDGKVLKPPGHTKPTLVL